MHDMIRKTVATAALALLATSPLAQAMDAGSVAGDSAGEGWDQAGARPPRPVLAAPADQCNAGGAANQGPRRHQNLERDDEPQQRHRHRRAESRRAARRVGGNHHHKAIDDRGRGE